MNDMKKKIEKIMKLPYVKYILGAIVLALLIVGCVFLFKGDKETEGENLGLEEVEMDEGNEDFFDVDDDSSDADEEQDGGQDKDEDKADNNKDDKDDNDNQVNDGSEGRIF